MNCQKCGSALNPESIFCPVCGARIEDQQATAEPAVSPGFVVPTKLSQEPNAENTFSDSITEALPVPETSPSLSGQDHTATFEGFSDSSDKKKKFSKKQKALIISGISVLLIGILCVAGYFLLWPKLAQERLQEEINLQAESIAEDIATYLDDLKALKGNTDKTSSYKLDAKLSDSAQKDVLKLVRKNVGSEAAELMNWINDIGCDADLTYDGDLIKGDLFIRANNQDITPVNIVLDTKNGNGYLTLPDVNKSALEFEFDSSELSLDSSASAAGVLYESLDLIPEKEVTQRLFASYIKMLLAGISDVDSVDDKFDANGIKPDSTCYEFKITASTFTKNLRNILEDLKKNKDVEQILNNAEAKYETTGIKDDFYESIDSVLADLNEDEIKQVIGNHLLFKIWVDDDDNFLGLGVKSDKSLFDVTYMSALQGNKYGSALTIIYQGIKLNIDTKGSISGGKFNGSTDFSSLGLTLTLQYSDFDVEKYKNDLTSGTYTFEPPAELMQLLSSLDISEVELFEDISKIILRRDQKSKTESDMSITIDKSEQFYCTVDYSSSYKDKQEVSIPSDVATGILNWMRNANLDTVPGRLKDAGCPFDLLDIVKILLF